MRLERMVCGASNWLDTRGLTSTAWAAAVLQRPALLSAALTHSSSLLRDATLQDAAVVAWALGRLQLGREHPRVLDTLASASIELLETFSPQALALRILHCMDLSAPPHAAARSSAAAAAPLRRLGTTNPKAMTKLLCGFAACDYTPNKRLVAALGLEAARQLPLFDACSLAFLLSAHARLWVRPSSRLLLRSPHALEQALQSASPSQAALAAALAVWSFARMRVHPGARALDACDAALAQAAAPGLGALTTARLVGAVWGFGALGTRPTRCWPALAATLAGRELRPSETSLLRAGLLRLERSCGALEGDANLWSGWLAPPGTPKLDARVWLGSRSLEQWLPPGAAAAV
jgi:hypothetical protein